MEEDVKSLSDYALIAWRRKFLILVPFVLVLAVTVLTVMLLPAVYHSKGTILIESQQIPQELIKTTVTTFADERIQVIKQRIMTSQQLFSIIKKFNLYKDVMNTRPRSEILDDMRNRIAIRRVSANVKNKRKGSSALIAFTVAFEHQAPGIAQKVANELVTLFLDENIKSRTARAAETTAFLQKEGDRLRSQIEVMEGQIATYKQENKGSLPDNLRINLKRVEDIRELLFNAERELSTLQEKQKLLTIDLDIVDSGSANSLNQQSPIAQLKQMQNQFVSLSARYGAEHPDVKSLQRKINIFQEEYGQIDDKSDLKNQIEIVQSEISALTQKYSTEHPDVKRLKRKVVSLESMLENSIEGKTSDTATVVNNDPEYLQAKARLESTQKNIKNLEESRVNLEKQMAELNALIDKTPQVERGLDALERDYGNTKSKYQEIKSKQLQAELSKSLEEDQKGERFTLLEPPSFPDKPIKPNRPKLFLLGLILAIASGIGLAGVAEALDGGIRGARALAAVTKMTPLITIPYITTKHDEAIRKRNLKIALIALAILGIVFILVVHFFYKPLDVLWFLILRKLNLA